MIPGQVYRLDIALRQTSHRITAGSRLVIEISAINDGAIGDEPGRDMIHYTLTHPSRLWLTKVQSPQALRELREAKWRHRRNCKTGKFIACRTKFGRE